MRATRERNTDGMVKSTDPGPFANPGATAAHCQICLLNEVWTWATGYHEVTGRPACDKHRGCTCLPDDPDPTCPLHSG